MAIMFIVLATSICVYFDARSLGLGKGQPGRKQASLNLPPFGWAIACIPIWPIAFPAYLVCRHQYASSRSKARSDLAFKSAALEKLTDLRKKGAISEAEFQQQKQDILEC
jgi:hypothetical protein